MNKQDRRGEWTIVLALLGAVMFSGAILDGFTLESLDFVLGIPSLYLYLFGAWAVLILLLALVMESRHDFDRKPPESTSSNDSRGSDPF